MTQKGDTDRALVAAARAGDTAAFAALLESHAGIAHRVAYVITRSNQDAADATQEAFVKAYLKLRTFRDDAAFRPWLLTIVGNEARNRVRARWRRDRYETEAGFVLRTTEDDPADAAIATEVRTEILSAVDQLPRHERLVVSLRYFGQLSERETAAALNIPTGTVKSRHARAMRRLRTHLKDRDV